MTTSQYKEFFDLTKLIKNIQKAMPKFDVQKFMEAFEFAEEAHRGQLRKDGITPYIVHPVRVVEILADMHADQDVLISALLHDVPEDTDRTIEDVEKAFGKKIAFLVDGITKFSKVNYKHAMPEREVESLKKMLLHTSKDPRVVLIKLADRLHNMRTLEHIKEPEKRLRIAGETLEIYVPIANLFGIQYLRIELQELSFKYLFPPEYEQIRDLMQKQNDEHSGKLAAFEADVKKICKENGISAEIFERKRNLYNIYKKIRGDGRSIKDVENRIAVRILVDRLNECYQVLGLIHGKYTPRTGKFADYIANPKPNGYRSLHTTVFGSDGIITQIQIRTYEMNTQVEHGIAEHFIRNEGDKLSDDARSSWVDKIVDIEKNGEGNGTFLQELKDDIFQDRIAIFTPKGRSIDLPKGSSVIDFAYAIHSELGDHAARAEINGKTMPITTTLKRGDTVRVIVDSSASPELFWFSFVATNFAKGRIKNYLHRIGKVKKISEGRKILQKEFDIAALGLLSKINFKKVSLALTKELCRTFTNMEAMLIAIGEGDIRAIDVVKSIKKQSSKVSGKGIKVIVQVVAKNKFGLLREIIEVFYKGALDMLYLKGYSSFSHENAHFTVKILVGDIETVGKLFDELLQIESVKYVYRISQKGLVLTALASVVTVLLWILHPFALEYTNQYPFTINISLLLLFLGVMYLTHAMKKYFPYVRNRLVTWMVAFSIPTLALFTLAIELFYFNLELSWVSVLIEVAMIYTYLGISFVNFRRKI